MLWRPRLTSQTAIILRTRYVPKSRIGQGLITIAPWLSLVLLVFTFLAVGSQVLVQPGVVVELPSAPFTDGFQSRWLAVILSVPGQGDRRESIVFFDDERFRLSEPAQVEALRLALQRKLRELPDPFLVIQADRSVEYGSIVQVVNLARQAGVKRVNQAVKP